MREFCGLDIPVRIRLGKIIVLSDIYLLNNEHNDDCMEKLLKNHSDKETVDFVRIILNENIDPNRLYFGKKEYVTYIGSAD